MDQRVGTDRPPAGAPPAGAARRAVTWDALRAALSMRPGWRRRGAEWHGPCPLSGDGRDTCWFGPGERAEVRAGCRRCGTRLDDEDFLAHLRAVVDLPRPPPPAAAAGRDVFEPDPDPRPARVWAAAVRLDPSQPGFAYLADRRRVIDRARPAPPAVRWLPARRAAAAGCRPALPPGAAGALVYRFAGPLESETRAVQVEAVLPGGRAAAFRCAGKRPSVLGSWIARGRRVFVAAAGRPGGGLWLVEGPLDALAVVRLSQLGVVDLAGAAVFGAAGAPAGFRRCACWASGPVVVSPDSDAAGDRAAHRLGLELALAGRSYRVYRAGPGADWSAVARMSAIEREAMAHE